MPSLAGSGVLRRLAYAGARYGPRPWLRYSPALFGLLFFAALPEQRRRIGRNLTRMFGPGLGLRRQLQVGETFVRYAQCLAEGLASGRADVTPPSCRVIGIEFLREALSSGRGAVLVTAHVGPWDAAAQLLSREVKSEVLLVMEREQSLDALRFHDGHRARSGLKVVHAGTHPLDALVILRHLRQGGVVAIQIDRTGAGRSIDATLFGAATKLPLGPFLLASKAGVPLLPLFACRTGFFEYEVSVCRPIALPTRPEAEDLLEAAQAAARCMQSFLEAHPTQWFDFIPQLARPTSGTSRTTWP